MKMKSLAVSILWIFVKSSLSLDLSSALANGEFEDIGSYLNPDTSGAVR